MGPGPGPLMGLLGYRREGWGYWGIGVGDFCETILTNLNFASPHIFFVYPKKLSYSSRTAYIKKIIVRELGKSICPLKNLNTPKTLRAFL